MFATCLIELISSLFFAALKKKRLIHITPSGPSHEGSKRNLVLCPLSFSTICPFIVMKHRPAEADIQSFSKREREKKLRVCQGRAQDL